MARKSGSSGEETAKQLRQAALMLFARDGYAAVSMRQIAKEVGVQAGALYLYTADKQSLLFELLRHHMEELLQAWGSEAKDITASPSERLEQFVRFHIHYHLECADEVFLSYMELRNLTPENYTAIETHRRKYEAILQSILQDGQEAAVFTGPDPKVSAYAIIAMLTGMTTWYRQEGRLSLDEIEAIYLDLVFGAVGASRP